MRFTPVEELASSFFLLADFTSDGSTASLLVGDGRVTPWHGSSFLELLWLFICLVFTILPLAFFIFNVEQRGRASLSG